jgi:hypothetical protein
MYSSSPSGTWRDIVARASSASKPSALIAGTFMASRISSRWSSCDLSSSGIAERCALYSGKIFNLNSGIPPSHTTPRPTSSSVSSSLSSMLVKPYSALVGRPLEVLMLCGSA